jgi:glucokinase
MTAPSAAPYPRFVADIGGTSARFAWSEAPGRGLTHPARYECAEHAGVEEVIARYLADHGRPQPRAAAIGIATAVLDDRVAMTNLPWAFSIAALQRQLQLDRLLVMNDFAVLAHGLASAEPEELRAVGAGRALPGEPVAVLGPGTGLGVSGLLTTRVGKVPIAGEGGHATLSAADVFEDAVLERLRSRFGHASAERALSGAGLVNLYQACCDLAAAPAEPIEAAEITARASAGTDPHCARAVGLFLAFLGGFAGNLALTFGARGGVFIAGGIVPQLGSLVDASDFRERFEAKGRFRDYLEAIPTFVVLDASAIALRGAAAALDA